jgi:hypothetical protein
VKRKRIMILPLRVLMSLQLFLWIIWDCPFFQANKKCIEKKGCTNIIYCRATKVVSKNTRWMPYKWPLTLYLLVATYLSTRLSLIECIPTHVVATMEPFWRPKTKHILHTHWQYPTHKGTAHCQDFHGMMVH